MRTLQPLVTNTLHEATQTRSITKDQLGQPADEMFLSMADMLLKG